MKSCPCYGRTIIWLCCPEALPRRLGHIGSAIRARRLQASKLKDGTSTARLLTFSNRDSATKIWKTKSKNGKQAQFHDLSTAFRNAPPGPGQSPSGIAGHARNRSRVHGAAGRIP